MAGHDVAATFPNPPQQQGEPAVRIGCRNRFFHDIDHVVILPTIVSRSSPVLLRRHHTPVRTRRALDALAFPVVPREHAPLGANKIWLPTLDALLWRTRHIFDGFDYDRGKRATSSSEPKRLRWRPSRGDRCLARPIRISSIPARGRASLTQSIRRAPSLTQTELSRWRLQ